MAAEKFLAFNLLPFSSATAENVSLIQLCYVFLFPNFSVFVVFLAWANSKVSPYQSFLGLIN